MDNDYILTEDGELQHWGIKGMKWGIRRYQNKDGSLTPAGKRKLQAESEKLKEREAVVKRQERNRAKFEKLAVKKAELEEREEALKNDKKNKKSGKGDSEKPKSVKDMSNEELHGLISRLALEKSYYDAQKNLANSIPENKSAGKKFVDGLMNDVVVPAAKNVGRSWLENTLKDKLGLNDVDPIKKLEGQYKKLDLEQKIERLKSKNPDDELSWDERLKKQQYEQNEYKNARERANDAKADAETKKSGGKGNKNTPADNDSNTDSQGKKAVEKKNNTASSSNHKYDKKEKVNGEWVYFYETPKSDYGTKAYQKRVDKALSKIDNQGWDTYNKSTTYGTKEYERHVNTLLRDIDDRGWDLYNSSKNRK